MKFDCKWCHPVFIIHVLCMVKRSYIFYLNPLIDTEEAYMCSDVLPKYAKMILPSLGRVYVSSITRYFCA